ncbi:unnamed protein product [Clonostachys rosea f. rosea IK726]|uniref:Uncharacterized protein n=1 Tax=Clonostachys rosea f. rosea IK726 TaxID=1349383 RepID=A0ACA9UGR9_BIOOC|nr:unnamed protein product [Clonostachys rosea f. rosea IK726]
MRSAPLFNGLLAAAALAVPAAAANDNPIVTCTQPNLFSNPSFENSAITPWATSPSGGSRLSSSKSTAGSYVLNLPVTSSSTTTYTVTQSVTLVKDTEYAISIDRYIGVKAGNTKTCSFYMYQGTTSNKFASISNQAFTSSGAGNAFSTWTGTFTATASGSQTIGLYLSCSGSSTSDGTFAYLDNASISTTASCCQQNAFTNPSFESGLTGWSFTDGANRASSSAQHSDGLLSLADPLTDGKITAKQAITGLSTSSTYDVEFDYQVDIDDSNGGTAYRYCSVTLNQATSSTGTTYTLASVSSTIFTKSSNQGWKNLKVTGFTPKASSIYISATITCTSGSATGKMYMDDFKLFLSATCPAPSTTSSLSTVASTTSVASTSSAASSTVASTTPADSSTAASSTAASSTPADSSTASSSTAASSTDVSSTAASSTPASTDVSSTAAASTTAASSTDVSSTPGSSTAAASSTAASSTDVSSTAASSTPAAVSSSAPSACQTNGFSNPSFETGLDGWSFTQGSANQISWDHTDGASSVAFSGTEVVEFSQTVSGLTTREHTISIDYRVNGATAPDTIQRTCQLSVSDESHVISTGPSTVYTSTQNTEWKTFQATWTPTDDSTDVTFLLSCTSTGSSPYAYIAFDNAKILVDAACPSTTVASTTPASTTDVSSTAASSTAASSTPASSTDVSSTAASSTDVSSTAASSTPASTDVSSTAAASSTDVSSTPASTDVSSTAAASSTDVSSTPAASTTDVSSTPASTDISSTAVASSTDVSSTPASTDVSSTAAASSTDVSSTPVASSTDASSTPASSTGASSTDVSSTPASSDVSSTAAASSTDASSTPSATGVSSTDVSSTPASSDISSTAVVSSTDVSSTPGASSTDVSSTLVASTTDAGSSAAITPSATSDITTPSATPSGSQYIDNADFAAGLAYYTTSGNVSWVGDDGYNGNGAAQLSTRGNDDDNTEASPVQKRDNPITSISGTVHNLVAGSPYTISFHYLVLAASPDDSCRVRAYFNGDNFANTDRFPLTTTSSTQWSQLSGTIVPSSTSGSLTISINCNAAGFASILLDNISVSAGAVSSTTPVSSAATPSATPSATDSASITPVSSATPVSDVSSTTPTTFATLTTPVSSSTIPASTTASSTSADVTPAPTPSRRPCKSRKLQRRALLASQNQF